MDRPIADAAPARRVLMGRPLTLMPADLDLAAEVTQVDEIMARGWWWRHAPARFIDILEAMGGLDATQKGI